MNNCTEISKAGGGTSSWVSPRAVSTSGRRIRREMAELNNDPPLDCSAGPKGDNLYSWVSTVIGPPGFFISTTPFVSFLKPYEGGIFFVDITFPADYPFKPLKVVFRTRICNCNVDLAGNLIWIS